MRNDNDITRDILSKIRGIQEGKYTKGKLISEEVEKGKVNAIAITDEPKFGQNVLTNQINEFRASVESGAQFSKPSATVSECPLIYLPDTGNLVFSGTIPCLNNMKWQFVLRTSTGNGCFIWSEGLILNKDNIQILNKLYGFYENWRNEWNTSSSDLDAMAKNVSENE